MRHQRKGERWRIRLGERRRAYAQALYQEIDPDICTERLALHQILAGGISERVLASATEDELKALEEALDDFWRRDPWESRLAPFLSRLGLNVGEQAVAAFTWLVRHGCQPDFLAEQFSRAVVPKAKPTAALKNAERYTEKLVARLIGDADLAEALLDHVRAHGLGTGAPLTLPRMLRDLAEQIRFDKSGAVSKSKLQNAHLLGALTHIKKVIGTHRHDESGQIVNALRAAADQEPIDMETLVTYAKRARKYSRDLLKRWRLSN